MMTPSNIVGTFLMAIGGVLIVLWALGDLGILATQSGILTYILATVACLGLGIMLRAGQGDRIGEAFMWWFKRGKRGPSD